MLDGDKVNSQTILYNPNGYSYAGGRVHAEADLKNIKEYFIPKYILDNVNFIQIQRPLRQSKLPFDAIVNDEYVTVWNCGTFDCQVVFSLDQL